MLLLAVPAGAQTVVDVCALGFRAIISTDTTWTADRVYVANGCHVEIEQGATLTLQPGTVVRVGGICYRGKGCSFAVRGALQAPGTASQPIAITSLHDDSRGGSVGGSSGAPAAGDWYGLHFAAGSRGRLEHLFLGYGGSRAFAEYGGAAKWNEGHLEIFDADVELLNSDIDTGLIHGIFLGPYNATSLRARIENVRISRHRYREQDAYRPAHPIYQQTINMDVTYRQLTFTDNDADGVAVQDTRLTRDATLGGTTYLLEACGYTACSIHVPADWTLTVLPETTIELASHWNVTVAGGGSLLAEGTPAAPITFARLEQLPSGAPPANWGGFVFDPGARARLSDCDIGRAGGYFQNAPALDVRSSDVRLRHCVLHDHPKEAVYVREDAQPTLRYVEVLANGYGVRNYVCCGPIDSSPGAAVDARANWWGDVTGPLQPRLNPDGLGAQISEGVGFEPWLGPFDWLDVDDALFHDAEPLRWATHGMDSGGLRVDVHAVADAQSYVVGIDLPPTGSLTWQSRDVPDGRYELRATLRATGGGVVAEVTRPVVVNNAAGLVFHGGHIRARETWTAGVIHIVESDVEIESGAQVVIAAGALVKVAPAAQIAAYSGGRLTIDATPSAATVLTALADDVGGDTNLDDARSIPRAGDWRGVTARGSGVLEIGVDVEMRYASLTHAGALAQNETWTSGRLHLVTGDVTVPAGVTLTIEPGAQVKVEARQAIIVQAGGRLVAEGSVAQPIAVTSSRDDAVGGDTDGDAGADPAAAGDWRGLHFAGGQGLLDHVTIAYAGGTPSGIWDTTAGAVSTTAGAVVSLANSRILDPFFEGVLAWGGGDVTLASTLIAGADRAVNADGSAMVRLTNCTIDDSRIGIWGHGGQLTITNALITNSLEAGIDNVLSSPLTLRYSDVWSEQGTDYVRIPDQTGQNGNVSVDPKYKGRARRNYRLGYASPAIDAADGSLAPLTDAAGAPRYDDPRTPNTGTPAAGGALADIGAYEFVETAESNVNLVVTQVTGPSRIASGDRITISWVITNLGSEAAVGPWYDQIVLVYGGESWQTTVLIAEIAVGAGQVLGPGQSYTAHAEVTVPAIIDGTARWEVVTNVRGDVFEGRHTEDNVSRSAIDVAVEVEPLVIDGPEVSSIVGPARASRLYRVQTVAGSNFAITLEQANAALELYGGAGYVPVPEHFDARSLSGEGPIAVSDADALPYYVLVTTRTTPEQELSFRLRAQSSAFDVVSVTPAAGGNTGSVTLAIRGHAFPDQPEVELITATGASIAARSVLRVDGSMVVAVVDLAGAAVGSADVRVAAPEGAGQHLPGGFQITAGGEPEFWFDIVGPDAVRAGREAVFTLRWGNRGSVDAPMQVIDIPLLSGVSIALEPGGTPLTERLQILTAARNCPEPLVPAGYRDERPIYVTPSLVSQFRLDPSAVAIGDTAQTTTSIDWSALGALVRPDGLADQVWEGFWQQFTAQVGNTWASFLSALARDAMALNRLEDPRASGRTSPGVTLIHAILLEMDTAWRVVANAGSDAGREPSGVGPSVGRAAPARRIRSLVISIGEGGAGEAELPKPYQAAWAVQDFLEHHAQQPWYRNETLYDQAGKSGDDITPAGFLAAVDRLAGRTAPDETAFFYFTGHSGRDSFSTKGAGGIHYQEVIDRLNRSRAGKIVVVLDSCHSEGFIRQLRLNHVDEDRWSVVTAAKVGQTATTATLTPFYVPLLTDAFFNALGKGGSLRNAYDAIGGGTDIDYGNLSFHTQEPQWFGTDHALELRDPDGAAKHPLVSASGLGAAAPPGAMPCGGTRRLSVAAAEDDCSPTVRVAGSFDPNEKTTSGAGAARYVVVDDRLTFTVYFENDPAHGATAPVQELLITDELSPSLDWDTVALGAIGIGASRIEVPPERDTIATGAHLPDDPYLLRVDAHLDPDSGRLTWRLTSVDKTTQQLPEDPFAGFLPVNDHSGRGQGFVTFSIKPKPGLSGGTRIRNQATITFDPTYGVNPPIVTNETWNTIGTPPVSGCAGDCNDDGEVTIDELIKGVNIALEALSLATCVAFDTDGDGAVAINELILGVGNALSGCQGVPPTVTPGMPTPTSTRTTSPSPTVTLPPIVTASATATRTRTATPTASASRSTTPSATPTVTIASPTTTPGGGTAANAVAGGAVAVANGMSVIPSVIAAVASGFQYGGSGAALAGAEGGIAAGCPQGGTATRSGNVGGTISISLSGCRLATADGLLALDGSLTLSGLFTLTATVDVAATLLDATGTTTRQIATAVLAGTITPQLGGACYVTGGTFQLTSGTLTNQIPGAGTVTVGFTTTTVGIAVASFSADCVPVSYSLTFNGPVTIGLATGAGTAASSSFDVTFTSFTVSQDARSAPTQTQMAGSVISTCFGGTVGITTRAALAQTAGTACPSAGVLRMTAAATTDLLYTGGGGVGIDTNLDGVSEATYASCLDDALHTCVAPGGTPTATRTPTRTAAASVTPSSTPSRTSAPATATSSPTRTHPASSPTATATTGFATPTSQPPVTATPTRTPGEHVYCDTLTEALPIPDSDENGISDQISIADDLPITALRVRLQITHTWVGDLIVELAHVDTLSIAILIYRPGDVQSPPYGCSADHIDCTLDDTAVSFADDQCASSPPAIGGTVLPADPLSLFDGERSAGDWMLFVSDVSGGDTGSLVRWCLEVQ